MASDVVVVGGGVVGLSIAYRLSREGVRVTVLDRGEMGREASWAGAGLIPANTVRLKTSPGVELRSWSAVLYEEWSATLREQTGLDNGYRRCGGVDVAWTEEEEVELRSMSGRWRVEGIVHEKLAPKDITIVEPALHPDLRAVYFLPDRAQIRNPRHLQALRLAAERQGTRFRPGAPALGFVRRAGRVEGVETPEGPLSCGSVVISAGAWSEPLLGGLGIQARTPPVKGQMVLLRSERPLLRRIVEHGDRYLVPRDDGHVLVGATEEYAGFDKRPTTTGVHGLLQEALRLCPRLAEAEVERAWAGLRPGSMDARPYIGGLPGYDNAFVATGHRRTGLQLSTATAEVITDLVLGRPPRVDLTPFRIGREPDTVGDGAFRS